MASYSPNADKPLTRKVLLQGQVLVSAELDVEFSTVLGSCVAACLYDPEARIGGMNHFLLAEPPANGLISEFAPLYGSHLMALLIEQMLARGAARKRLRAHLYGGANLHDGMTRIGTMNADFARAFMIREGIPLVRANLGGRAARRVGFRPALGWVRCSRIKPTPPDESCYRWAAPRGRGQAPRNGNEGLI